MTSLASAPSDFLPHSFSVTHSVTLPPHSSSHLSLSFSRSSGPSTHALSRCPLPSYPLRCRTRRACAHGQCFVHASVAVVGCRCRLCLLTHCRTANQPGQHHVTAEAALVLVSARPCQSHTLRLGRTGAAQGYGAVGHRGISSWLRLHPLGLYCSMGVRLLCCWAVGLFCCCCAVVLL